MTFIREDYGWSTEEILLGAIYFPPTNKQTLPGSKKGKKRGTRTIEQLGENIFGEGGGALIMLLSSFPFTPFSFKPFFFTKLFSLFFLHLPPFNRSLFSATSDRDPSHWRLPPWERSRFKRICFKLRMQLRFLVYQNTALSSTLRPSSILRHRRDISTFLDNLKV